MRSCSSFGVSTSGRLIQPHPATNLGRPHRRPSSNASGSLRNQHVLRSAASSQTPARHRLVFLGTPEVAAAVLKRLVEASRASDATFEVAAVISQPGKPKGRSNRGAASPSPTTAAALELGLREDQILCPASAKDPEFLERLAALRPDLCVTAAYGNMLPRAFLAIPRLGTLNIHPSLLPRYRGAAPVQRAVQDGVTETGVSVAYTVLRCDAGPILAQQKEAVGPNEQAPELLSRLFGLGVDLLLSQLPSVWDGGGRDLAVAQDESLASNAAKLGREEGLLDLASMDAATLHNRVRAFAGWPGTSAGLVLKDPVTGARERIDVKILSTRLGDASDVVGLQPGCAGWLDGSMVLPCGGGGALRVLQVQPPTKKAMSARDFQNGLRGKRVHLAGDASPEVQPFCS